MEGGPPVSMVWRCPWMSSPAASSGRGGHVHCRARGQVLDVVWLQVEAVRELVEHCAGLHEPNVLVPVMES